MSRGRIDLHCHPLPAVDDGCRTPTEGAALLSGLHALGFDTVVATPHVHSGRYANRIATLTEPERLLREEMAAHPDRNFPTLHVAAEHHFDDESWELFEKGQALPYPGGRAALVEFSYDNVPVRVELRLFRLARKGITPVLAHPERYSPLQRSHDRLLDLIGAGVLPLLDVMSLVGGYGRSAQAAAEAFLAQDLYVAACSDAHKPEDLGLLEEAFRRVHALGGDALVDRLFVAGPTRILGGAQRG